MTFHYVRKGEWLEYRGSSLPENLPLKWLHKLKRENGIQVFNNGFRLRMFPESEFGFDPEYMELDVLYEDDFCMIVNKPASMLVHPTLPGQKGTLAHYVAGYYAMTGQQCAVRHVHRLDRDTTGAILFAKNDFALLVLDERMRSRQIKKTYLAISEGTWRQKAGTISEPIGKDRFHPKRRRVSKNGKQAVTHYRVVAQYEDANASLLELHLETGRTHQIRVHLAYLGHPLFGDQLYGGPTDTTLTRQALHSYAISFSHPWTRETVTAEATLASDMSELLRQFEK